MVRAILAGKKTQTRRVVGSMHPPEFFGVRGGPDENDPLQWGYYVADGMPWGGDGCLVLARGETGHDRCVLSLACPYGDVGDRLWVRETWAEVNGGAFYKADEPWPEAYGPEPKWKPSIHMPRWASRIILEVTDVRVERVQDTTEEDAKAEGVESLGPSIGAEHGFVDDSGRTHGTHPYTLAFACLWDEINADRGFPWRDNPWVWCLTFKRVQP
jgi:hypothetical protein